MIDYVLVNRCFRTSVLDTRVYRSTFHESDHKLVVSALRFKIKAKRRHTGTPCYQTMNVSTSHQAGYQSVLAESLTDLEYTDDMALLANNWSDLTAMLDSLSICCKKLGLTISCKKNKNLAVLPPNDPAAESFHASYGINARSRPAPRLGSLTASSFQPCCMAWRALSSLSLLCADSSPVWSTACGPFWGFLSSRRSDTPPYARWPSSRQSHPSSLSAVCASLGTYPGCQRKDYLSSFLCLPLLGASILPRARSVSGTT